jgi:hypothetical protein
MTEADAIRLTRAYAAEWGVPCGQVRAARKERTWYFAVETYRLAVDAGDGVTHATVDARAAAVRSFEHYPEGENGFLPPLWAAFPTYSPLATGGRQGNGEVYNDRWYWFYRNLSDGQRADYRRRFPPPDDDRGWQGFYEHFADVRAGGTYPIAEFIVGRVP